MYNELLTISHFESRFLPLLKEGPVTCALCNKSFPHLWPHLRVHSDFLEKKRGLKRIRKTKNEKAEERHTYPNQVIDLWTIRKETLPETYTRLFGPTSLINGMIDQVFRLYEPSKSEWTIMEPSSSPKWSTITTETKGWAMKTNFLTKYLIKEHFRGQITVGIRSRSKYNSKFMVFVIDAAPQGGETYAIAENRAKQTTLALVKVIKRHNLEPHVIGSGSKGYHISLFFDNYISYKIIKSLFNYFFNHPDVPIKGVKVECLPLKHAVKLPLGIHWGAKKFCSFLDPLTLVPLVNPYLYLLKIKPINRNILDSFLKETEAKKPHKRKMQMDTSWSLDSMEMSYKIGIEERGTRHDKTLLAAAYAMNHFKPKSEGELYVHLYK
ncbi:MAG: TOTE conflict system archaeo-eukaryotic primase domain-containing protein [Heyndrickxia sp.]